MPSRVELVAINRQIAAELATAGTEFRLFPGDVIRAERSARSERKKLYYREWRAKQKAARTAASTSSA